MRGIADDRVRNSEVRAEETQDGSARLPGYGERKRYGPLGLDKDHISIAIGIGDDAFVKTRTFVANPTRSKLKLKEK